MSSIGKMTLCLMEAIGRTLLRFPWLIWIEVKTLLCFESVLFQDDCPYFLGKLFSGNGFIPKCITKFAICTWCALNTASSCFLFLVSPFSLHLSPNRFLFRNFPTFFPFFFFFFSSIPTSNASLRRALKPCYIKPWIKTLNSFFRL